ncbi:MAG: helix-turn-helix domain-containing protein [Christensenellales bacterium]
MDKKDNNLQHFDVLSRMTSLLRAKGWTRYRLAKEAGLSTTTINNLWLRNNSPSIATLEDICRALGITMAEFFTLPGEKAPALTLEQQALLARWDQLSQEQRTAFLLLMQGCSGAPDTAPSHT